MAKNETVADTNETGEKKKRTRRASGPKPVYVICNEQGIPTAVTRKSEKVLEIVTSTEGNTFHKLMLGD